MVKKLALLSELLDNEDLARRLENLKYKTQHRYLIKLDQIRMMQLFQNLDFPYHLVQSISFIQFLFHVYFYGNKLLSYEVLPQLHFP